MQCFCYLIFISFSVASFFAFLDIVSFTLPDQHNQEGYYGDEQQNYNENNYAHEEYWDHNQHWDQSEHPPFPPHHDMNFQHQAMNYGSMHPHMMQQFYQHAMHPDSGPTMSIPEQVLAAQIPEMNVAGTVKLDS